MEVRERGKRCRKNTRETIKVVGREEKGAGR